MGCPTKRGAQWFASTPPPPLSLSSLEDGDDDDATSEAEEEEAAAEGHGVWLYHFTRPRNGSATYARTHARNT
eukprot:COSAG06_NODE_757_length_12510_cov_69.462529_2_plen_73_part_00